MMKTINDIVEITSGFAFRSKDFKDNSDTGYPIIRIQNLNGTTSEFKYWDLDYDEKYLIYKNDILLSLSGNVKLDVWEGSTGLLNQRIIKIDPKNGIIKDWLFYLLQSIVSDIERLSKKSIISNISVRDLKKINVKVPSVDKQKEIAEVLNKASEVKTKRQQQIEALSALKQSIFFDMFGDPLANDENWGIIKLGEIAEKINYGLNTKATESNDGLPILRIPNIKSTKIDLFDLKNVQVSSAEYNKTKLLYGDLLFVRSNGNPDYIGRCAMFDLVDEYVYASYLIRVRVIAESSVKPEFLEHLFSFQSYKRYIAQQSRTTAGNYNINTKSLKQLKIITPSIELQDSFLKKINKIEKQEKILYKSMEQISILFDSLLHKAFNGELIKEDIKV